MASHRNGQSSLEQDAPQRQRSTASSGPTTSLATAGGWFLLLLQAIGGWTSGEPALPLWEGGEALLSTYSCLYVVLTGAGQLSKPLEHNKLQVMGSSAESDQHNKRNLLPGIKSTTERTPTNRNNTSDMLPENNTGKDVEITERTQALKGTKQYRTPNNKM